MNRREAKDASHAGDDERKYTIAELAREFDITTRTIRFYEGEGLIAPARRGQTRVFSLRDRVRLKLILRGKRLGFSIGEIREIIDLYDSAPGEAGQLRFFLQKIAERRAMLERQRADIVETLGELATVEARCHERLAALERSGKGGGRAD
ncbi:MAG: MerR family DNA-binding transcriptional regulator [Rhodospirillales bacterium]|nr:MerR family DNA-binding transcriptional regulator [Rhodospirillales bacterium]